MYDSNDLPCPVIRDSKGYVREYTELDWAYRVREELDEALAAKTFGNRAEEIADTITVCVSWLNALGFDEQDRIDLFREINKKNRDRGYMEVFSNELCKADEAQPGEA